LRSISNVRSDVEQKLVKPF